MPDGGAVHRRHASPTRPARATYKLYVPSGYHGQPLPLVVMLHGCTQSPDDFAAGTRMNALAEEQTLASSPTRRRRQAANAQQCWNWFRRGDQRRDRGEPSLIAGITRQIMRDYRGRRRAASTSPACRPAAPRRRSWARPIPTSTPRSACIPASPAAPPATCPRRFAAMQQGANPSPPPDGRTRVPTIVFHGDQRQHRQPAQRRPGRGPGAGGCRRPAHARSSRARSRAASPTAARSTSRCERPRAARALAVHGAGHAWSGRQPGRHLHRPARAGRLARDAALLPRPPGRAGRELAIGSPGRPPCKAGAGPAAPHSVFRYSSNASLFAADCVVP